MCPLTYLEDFAPTCNLPVWSSLPMDWTSMMIAATQWLHGNGLSLHSQVAPVLLKSVRVSMKSVSDPVCIDQIVTPTSLEHSHSFHRPIYACLDVKSLSSFVEHTNLWYCQSLKCAREINFTYPVYATGSRTPNHPYDDVLPEFISTYGVRQNCHFSPSRLIFDIWIVMEVAPTRICPRWITRTVLCYCVKTQICCRSSSIVWTTMYVRFCWMFCTSTERCCWRTVLVRGRTLFFRRNNWRRWLDLVVFSCAQSSFFEVRHLGCRRDVRLAIKNGLDTVAVRSVPVYGSEIWPLKAGVRRRSVIEYHFLCSISKIWLRGFCQ